MVHEIGDPAARVPLHVAGDGSGLDVRHAEQLEIFARPGDQRAGEPAAPVRRGDVEPMGSPKHARLADDPGLVAVLAVDRAPVGCLVGEVTTRAVGQPATVGFVEWLYVEPESRGLGIGRAIIRAAVAQVRPLGVTHIEVASVPGDLQWQRRGWRETTRRYVAPVGDVVAWVGPEDNHAGG